ncbi:MAG: aminoglycoside phosphotransferase family protein [Candidatus Micrarchaeia archaeon]
MKGALRQFLSHRLGSIDSIAVLPGGIWNDSYLVEACGKRYVAKLYLPRIPAAFYGNSGWVEWRTLGFLEPLGIAPKPVLFSAALGRHLLVYEFVEGKTGRLRGRFLRLAARLLGRLHAIKPSESTRFVARRNDSIQALRAQIRARINRLDKKMPEHGDLLRFKHLLQCLPQTSSPPYSPSLLHTDPVPSNFIQGKKLILIDWQSPRFGDAAFDVWAFCSDAFQLWDLRRGMSRAEKRAFLRTYLSHHHDGTLPARLQAKAPLFALNLGLYYLERFTDFVEGRLAEEMTRGKEKLFGRYERVKDACLRELENYLTAPRDESAWMRA